MRIGYLHIGPPQHGVCRYGRLLAAEAHRWSELKVIEASVTLSRDWKHNQAVLAAAAKQLSTAEIIHFQYNKYNKLLWGGGWSQLYYFWVFIRHCSCPLVVTLHDVYPSPKLITLLKYLNWRLQPPVLPAQIQTTSTSNEPSPESLISIGVGRSALRSMKRFWRLELPDTLALRWLLSQVQLTFVCSQEESRRLNEFGKGYEKRVVPHFVEQRALSANSVETRAALNLEGNKVITLLGFIHSRKGHQLVIEALAELPQDVKAIFAGGANPGNEAFLQSLLALAKAKGVDDRLRVTGYLSETELERYLIATDLAICPFQYFSASGSLSTWISVARPILASALPQISEYNSLVPDAIKTFQPYSAAALAQAIRQLLPKLKENVDPAVRQLQQQLSLPTVFNQHLSHYCYAAKTHVEQKVRISSL